MKQNKFFRNSIKLTIISILISISVFCLFVNDLKVSVASNTETLVSTEKIYSYTDIDENFDDSSVIVIIDRINSGINKSHKNTNF